MSPRPEIDTPMYDPVEHPEQDPTIDEFVVVDTKNSSKLSQPTYQVVRFFIGVMTSICMCTQYNHDWNRLLR